MFQEKLFFTLGEGTGYVNRAKTPPDTTQVRHLNDSPKIFQPENVANELPLSQRIACIH